MVSASSVNFYRLTMSAKLFVLLAFLVSTSVGKPRSGLEAPFASTRIVGGIDATRGEFPHLISLQDVAQNSQNHICGGSILNEYWILTAAHCPVPQHAVKIYIKAGKHVRTEVEDTEQMILVESIFVHEKFNKKIFTDDIALLKLAKPLVFNEYVQPIRLPQKYSQADDGEVVLAGWGLLDFDDKHSYANILQKVVVPLVDLKTCEAAVDATTKPGHFPLLETNVCTGPLAPGISGCEGDSGGPIIKYMEDGQPEVVGIASWAITPCGHFPAPTVYTRVSMYIDWIESIMSNN